MVPSGFTWAAPCSGPCSGSGFRVTVTGWWVTLRSFASTSKTVGTPDWAVTLSGTAVAALWAPLVQSARVMPARRLSRNTVEASWRSPRSKIERYSAWGPGVTGVVAVKSGVAPPYGVLAASSALIEASPVAWMVMTWPAESEAKFLGALMAEPSVVQVDLSSSAMNASLDLEFTNSGNS